ncbi:MAG TPA: sugar ABC transporter substrate-binding protein [Thermotogota bacterium]|nr:sugar ABC transporter substrate-binding protein [Thermotogota bacterium]HRW92947.1 sugar ABC transporter substrate-binding protein [Thermotogota bacterium]
MRKFFVFVLLVAAVLSLGLAKTLRVGFIPMTLSNEYFITMVNAAQQEADKLGVTLLVQAGQRHGSAEEQMQIMENMITQRVDAICIVPSSSQGLIPVLRKAERAGIPVINLDTSFDAEAIKAAGLKPIPFIGTDNYYGAQIAGWFALSLLGADGEVAILTGISGQKNAADRRNGFYEVVSKWPNIKVVAEQTANWEVEQGYNVSQNIIQANPNLELIFASNDNMGLGALRAAQEAGKDITVIGYDAIPAALDAVANGTFAGTIAQFPAEMGIMGVQTAVKLSNGESVPEYIQTGSKLIYMANVEWFQEYLAQFE